MRTGRETDRIASEERVNVDRRWWGASMVRGRVLAAGLALLGAGGAVLGWSWRPQRGIPTATPGIACQFATAPASEPETAAQATKDAQVRANSLFAGLPLTFEPNQGQGNLNSTDPRARFVARGSGYSLFLGR